MTALFDQGFFVREPAWHGLGIFLDDYPTRDEAQRLAGHDFQVIERPVLVQGNTSTIPAVGFKALVKSGSTDVLNVVKDSYEVIQNHAAYDIAELLFEQGFGYETGITLDGGRQCAITLALNEPIQIPGDDSIVVPYGCLSWTHDGSGSLKVRSGTIRQVCANTVAASEAEGKKLGTDFTFRHTKNVADRIADARDAIKGTRAALDVYRQVATELGELHFTPAQRDLFVSEIVGDKGQLLSLSPTTSARVKNNIDAEKQKVASLFFGPTIPEAHQLTGYGLWLAGGEYFDHLRNYRSQDSYVRRTLLSDNPAKASLTKTIRELVSA